MEGKLYKVADEEQIKEDDERQGRRATTRLLRDHEREEIKEEERVEMEKSRTRQKKH